MLTFKYSCFNFIIFLFKELGKSAEYKNNIIVGIFLASVAIRNIINQISLVYYFNCLTSVHPNM